jgi:micrococcal nuclease
VVVWKAVLMLGYIIFRDHYKSAMLSIAILAIITPAIAINTWSGNVTHVSDGDTLWILPTDHALSAKPRKIRIDGIDAPEFCQQYGKQSMAALKHFLKTETISVTRKRYDDYGREVSKITINKTDVGSWMVSNGHAWSYHYRFSAGPYRDEEEFAKREKLGLFADVKAIEPRLFRKVHGSCHSPKKPSIKNLATL